MKKPTIKLIIFALVLISVSLYTNLYDINYDDLSNKTTLKNKMKITEQNQSDYKNIYSLGNYSDYENYRYTVLLINNKGLGLIKFKKGINNRYKIEEITCDNTSAIRTEIKPIKISNKYNSYLIYGGNPNQLINRISFNINNKTIIESKVPNGNYFIYSINFYDSNNQSNILTDFILLDKQGKRISNVSHLGDSSVVYFEENKAPYYIIFINIILVACFLLINVTKLLKKSYNNGSI
ncbi:hypothetical protein [Clostridium estertheticum]|uniref:Uncharacterized protein n=1 Tax=Clostridium estertheticum TaxID=238834 RepID=A0A7Y3SZF5_9CLOT|nr:hypothetical protein [Clostridium estertheticum]NNU77838.1 hypothetical protein [Clostridium estertheticum]WBL46115.1 hypothetical protein LOR37_15710 [Clostridium estertheticum]